VWRKPVFGAASSCVRFRAPHTPCAPAVSQLLTAAAAAASACSKSHFGGGGSGDDDDKGREREEARVEKLFKGLGALPGAHSVDGLFVGRSQL
jgi:hypothetical protein